jgi:hypothetical protein
METSSTSTNQTIHPNANLIENDKIKNEPLTPVEEEKSEISPNEDVTVYPKMRTLKKKTTKKEKQKKKEKPNKQIRKEINLNGTDNSKEVATNNNYRNNTNIIIEIKDDKEISPSKLEKYENQISKGVKKKQSKKTNNPYVHGYYPFIFYEKQKCKENDFSKISVKDYIKQISNQWKKMSEEEKEPYVKLALDYKRNLSNKPIIEKQLLSKKRKRNESARIEEKKDSKRKSLSVSSKSSKIVSVSVIKKRNRSETKNNILSMKKSDSVDNMNEFIDSVLVPFVKKLMNFSGRKE